MKGEGHGGGGSFPSKRRWKGLILAVWCLVLLSMLAPLIFLLGLRSTFNPSGFLSEEQIAASDKRVRKIDDLMKRVVPTIPKDAFVSMDKESLNDLGQITQYKEHAPPPQLEKEVVKVPDNTALTEDMRSGGVGKREEPEKGGGKWRRACEMKHGSYCLWRGEHRVEMKDTMVKKLKDQLFLARAYYPSVAKIHGQANLTLHLKQNIQYLEHVFSECSTDTELPPLIEGRAEEIEGVIGRAKAVTADCNNVERKLRQLVELTEDEAGFHGKQSAFLFHLSVQTMPKSLHCLSMRLTWEYFNSPPLNPEWAPRFSDPSLLHLLILSDNILASSVVINSSVIYSKDSSRQVFHVLTDGLNYYAMKNWFSRNTYRDAAVQVLNIEDLNLENPDPMTVMPLSLSSEFRVFCPAPGVEWETGAEYISVFSPSHYLIPEIFHNLDRVVVLDDDVVVQRDLSPLWDVDLEGKVNGAVEFCAVRMKHVVRFNRGVRYGKSCAWMSGLNVLDLRRWRSLNLTAAYSGLLQKVKRKGGAGVTSLRATLMTFKDEIHPLEGAWALHGLGHDYGIGPRAISDAAVLHYNGNMKPWLELAVPRYRNHWRRFLNRDDRLLRHCNVNL